MNQPTHAWLAVEAYRKISTFALTPAGKKKKLDGLVRLLGTNLGDVVVAAWLPNSLIKDDPRLNRRPGASVPPAARFRQARHPLS